MYFASVKLPHIHALPLQIMAIHDSFIQVNVFTKQHLSFPPTAEKIAKLCLIAILDNMLTQVKIENYHDYSLPDYFHALLAMISQIYPKELDQQTKIDDSLCQLKKLLEGRISYLDFQFKISHLGLTNPYVDILLTLGKAVVVCSFILLPQLYFAQILTAGICLSLCARACLLGFGLFAYQSQERAYEQQRIYIGDINATINHQLYKFFNVQLPQKIFWGPQLG